MRLRFNLIYKFVKFFFIKYFLKTLEKSSNLDRNLGQKVKIPQLIYIDWYNLIQYFFKYLLNKKNDSYSVDEYEEDDDGVSSSAPLAEEEDDDIYLADEIDNNDADSDDEGSSQPKKVNTF